MLARRLVLGYVGGRSDLPEAGRWTRHGAVLTASGWESPGVLEPCVIYDGTYRMWYRGGGVTGGFGEIGYATSADGITWTKYGSNPVIGGGASGEASTHVICPNVYKLNSTYYVAYSRPSDASLRIGTSSDGITWTLGPSGLSISGVMFYGNTSVWNEGGTTWKMLVEAYVTAEAKYRVFYATSTDGLSWTVGNGGAHVSGLESNPSTGGTSCPHFLWDSPKLGAGGLYEGWYHTGTGTTSDLYRASSSDLINWTIVSGADPLLSHTGTGYEVDQIADPHVTEVSSVSHLYYDGDDNATGVSAILLATFAGTLTQLVDGT